LFLSDLVFLYVLDKIFAGEGCDDCYQENNYRLMADYISENKNQGGISSSLSNMSDEIVTQYKKLPGEKEFNIEYKPAYFNRITPNGSPLVKSSSVRGERQVS
jgi:hypothetical protein